MNFSQFIMNPNIMNMKQSGHSYVYKKSYAYMYNVRTSIPTKTEILLL